jgi:hypothetical protein
MLASAEVDVMQTVADTDDVEASKLLVQRLLYRSLEMMRAEVAKFPRSRAYMMAKEFDPGRARD